MIDKRSIEVLDLLALAEAGELTNESRARLNCLLEASDDACLAVLHLALLDAEIAYRVRLEAASGAPSGIGPTDPVPNQMTRTSLFSALLRPSRANWFLGCAVGVLIAVAGVAWFQLVQHQASHTARPSIRAGITAVRVPQPAAVLVSGSNIAFQGSELAINDAIFEGTDLSLTKGLARVGMACGADLVLKAPCSIKVDTADRVELRSGTLVVDVAEWGTGFTVDTDAMRVVDLGTRFAVSATTDGAETHVLKGKVRVQPHHASIDGFRSVLVSEGEAIRVGRHNEPALRMGAEADRFGTANALSSPYKPIAMSNTGIGLEVGDQDSNWRITRGAVGAGFAGSQQAVVCATARNYARNEPLRSQWISFTHDTRDDGPGALPDTVFTFETSFDVSGYDIATITVAAQILADNGVSAIRINGHAVRIEPWKDTEWGQRFDRGQFRLIEIQNGFVRGKNRLEIDVWNGRFGGTGNRRTLPNPMALRVEFQAFGRLLENSKEKSDVNTVRHQQNQLILAQLLTARSDQFRLR